MACSMPLSNKTACCVSDYFKPKSTGMEVEGLKVGEAYFRGRKLRGAIIPLPHGYSAAQANNNRRFCICYSCLGETEKGLVVSFFAFKMAKAHYEADQKEAEWDEDHTQITFVPRALSVLRGNDDKYWRSITKNEKPVLELVQVCRLEVTGSTEVEPGKKYQVSFTVSLKPDAFGWSGCPVFMIAKVGKKGSYSRKKIEALEKADFGSKTIQIPDHDGDKLVIEVEPELEDPMLHFGLYEVWSGKRKGGLEIHNAIVQQIVS